MSSNKPKPLAEQRQVAVEFIAPQIYRGVFYNPDEMKPEELRVTVGENAAKKLLAKKAVKQVGAAKEDK